MESKQSDAANDAGLTYRVICVGFGFGARMTEFSAGIPHAEGRQAGALRILERWSSPAYLTHSKTTDSWTSISWTGIDRLWLHGDAGLMYVFDLLGSVQNSKRY